MSPAETLVNHIQMNWHHIWDAMFFCSAYLLGVCTMAVLQAGREK